MVMSVVAVDVSPLADLTDVVSKDLAERKTHAE